MLCSASTLIACSKQEPTTSNTAPTSEIAATPIIEGAPSQGEEARFINLMDSHARAFIANSPETATQLGLSEEIAGEGFQSRFSHSGFEDDQAARTMNENFFSDLKGISREVLPPDLAISYDILRTAYEMGAQRNQFNFGGSTYWGSASPYRITQLSGVHISLPRLLQNQQPLANVEDIEAYLARLTAMETVLDETAQMVRTDAELGVVPPVFALRGAASTMKSFISTAPEDNNLVTSFARKISTIHGIDEEAANAYQLRAVEIVKESVYPAYNRLEAAITGLIPLSVEGDGIWRLGPQGEEFYQHALDSYGGQGKTGAEIHELGLSEVKRITDEMDEIFRGLGLTEGSVAQRMDQFGKRPENQYVNIDAGRKILLEDLREQVRDIMAKAGDWFGTLPTQAVEVRRIPIHEQDTSPGGYYTRPSLDGTRPGIYWINLKNTADWPKPTLPTLTYHEAVPGHHFQISLQQAVKDMPLIRNMMFFSEFSEGWALYVEEVARDMGMYDDNPAGNLGRLQSELFRAARLVTDSGLHHERWTREQAIDYMVETTGNTRDYLTREVERYAVWPGQATSYKLGMLKIKELRNKAEASLGDAFDIREFHDEVLLSGALPLPVLDAKINRWIEGKKGA